jgi:hypothetical protein
MKTIIFCHAFFLSISIAFSANDDVYFWCEANTAQLNYFVVDVLAVPGYLHDQLSAILKANIRLPAGIKRIYDQGAGNVKNEGEVLVAREGIALYGRSNGVSVNPYRRHRSLNDFFISPGSAERATHTPLPLIIFGFGFLSVIKMKWIRMKNNLDLTKQ